MSPTRIPAAAAAAEHCQGPRHRGDSEARTGPAGACLRGAAACPGLPRAAARPELSDHWQAAALYSPSHESRPTVRVNAGPRPP